MIQIIRHYDGFDMLGHAGYAPRGHDIVCAGISALLETFLMSVNKLTTDEISSVISSGNAVIRYKGNLSRDAQLLADSFFCGVKAIADTYPENVRVTE